MIDEEKKSEDKKVKEVSGFVVPGGDDSDSDSGQMRGEKMSKSEAKSESSKVKDENDDDDDDDSDDDSDDDDDDDNDVDDAYDEDDYGEEEEDNEKTMNKFNLKSFSKQPTVLLSDGISVNLFLSNKMKISDRISNENENENENELFDAEKFGKDFLNERKKLANEEIEKLALEIKELDAELDEDEVKKKKVMLAKEKDEEMTENDVNLTSEVTPKLLTLTENEIITKKRKEIQKENKKNEEEREAVISFLLFSVLNQEINIQMKIKNSNGNQKDGFVTISVKQIENENLDNIEEDGENKENDEKDEKQFDSLAKFESGMGEKIKVKKTDKEKEKEKEKKENLITLLFQASDRIEPIVLVEKIRSINSQDENKNDNNKNEMNEDKTENQKKIKIKKNDYFVLAEKVLGPFLVTAFEV